VSIKVVFAKDPFLGIATAIVRTKIYIRNSWKRPSMTRCLVARKVFLIREAFCMIVTIGEFAFVGSIVSLPVFARDSISFCLVHTA
jgi:hypothetical protein